MVFFTCNTCGASLKKNQVEKHYLQQCRNCEVLTCVDCLKDFPGDSYKDHTQCITEEEKYSAKGWQPKANANKGAKKQEAWMDNIRTILKERSKDLDADVKNLLNVIVGFDNIPRKRTKFINFVQNALGRRTPGATIDKTWEVFEEAIKGSKKPEIEQQTKSNDENSENKESGEEKTKKKKKKEKSSNGQLEEVVGNGNKKAKTEESKTNDEKEEMEVEPEMFENQGVKMFSGTKSYQNGGTISEGSKHNGTKNGENKKRKRNEELEQEENEIKKTKIDDDEDESGEGGASKKFDWEFSIRKLLQKKGSMKVKRLKKKIVDEFVRTHGDTHKTRIQLEAKLEKKLRKNKEFRYLKDTVCLATSRNDE